MAVHREREERFSIVEARAKGANTIFVFILFATRRHFTSVRIRFDSMLWLSSQL